MDKKETAWRQVAEDIGSAGLKSIPSTAILVWNVVSLNKIRVKNNSSKVNSVINLDPRSCTWTLSPIQAVTVKCLPCQVATASGSPSLAASHKGHYGCSWVNIRLLAMSTNASFSTTQRQGKRSGRWRLGVSEKYKRRKSDSAVICWHCGRKWDVSCQACVQTDMDATLQS